MQGVHSIGHLHHPTQELAIRVTTLTTGYITWGIGYTYNIAALAIELGTLSEHLV